MIFFILAIVLFLLGGVFFRDENKNYLSKSQSNVIKGFFILLVFLSHAQQYITNSGYSYERLGDSAYMKMNSAMGQLIVAMFLFYSGYGVMESVKLKGDLYLKQFPQKRILTTILNFDIAVIFFALLALAISTEFSWEKLFFAFLGWESIGNSNWYIFVIVLCYSSTWLAMLISSNYPHYRAFFFIQTIIILIIFFVLVSVKETWWYDTIFTYIVGSYYSYRKDYFERIAKKLYFKLLLVASLSFIFFHNIIPLVNGKLFSSIPDVYYIVFGLNGNICAILLALIIVLLSMKIELNSKWFEWLGKNLFPLYIYQRFAMIVVTHYHNGLIPGSYPYLFVLICFMATCPIAYLYKYVQIKL